jgi:arylsulfatase A-like enzyme
LLQTLKIIVEIYFWLCNHFTMAIIRFLLTTSLFISLTLHCAAAEKGLKPNIIFILADDLGINDLACYGRKDHNTPNIDRLATEGLRFTSAYCALPICSPSRAAILTGKNPATLHLTTYLPGRPDCISQKLIQPTIKQQLPLEEKTIAEYLKQAGYTTACIGKWHLGGKGFSPKEQGFDLYHPGSAVTKPSATEGGKGEYDLTQTAIKFIETNKNKPFFLYLAHNSPHIPYSAKPELVEKNKNAFEPVYAAVIETLDDTVGILTKKLDELGLSKNTIVIFTSDNGGLHVPELSHKIITYNSPFRAGKGYLYEGGIRIPLIIKWSGQIPAGKVISTPVNNTDWLPTILDIVGIKIPKKIDGISIKNILLSGKELKTARRFFFHFPHYTNQGGRPAGAIRDGNWKLIENYEDGSIELYNLEKDPSETRNLASSEPKIAARLKNLLDKWRSQSDIQTNSFNPKFDPELHRKLYIDIDPSKFNPATASKEEIQNMLNWRKLMDEVTKMK